MHLSNGTELGPTTPVDMAPGEVLAVNLPSTQASFTGWIAHAEVGSGAEAGGEHASGGGSESASEGSGESGGGEGEGGEGHGPGGEGGSEAAREAAMSSPITPLDQTWNGVLGGLAISAQYDAATQSVNASVQNTTSQQLCYVQSEPHLKSGTQTVGELGPQKLGDLNPGQTVMSSLSVTGEPGTRGSCLRRICGPHGSVRLRRSRPCGSLRSRRQRCAEGSRRRGAWSRRRGSR